MKTTQNLIAINNFVETWKNRGYEKGDSHSFWLAFLRDIFHISEPEKIIQFEVPVKLKHKSFIDAFLPDTKIRTQKLLSSKNLLPLIFRKKKIKRSPTEKFYLHMNRLNVTESACQFPCTRKKLSSAISKNF